MLYVGGFKPPFLQRLDDVLRHGARTKWKEYLFDRWRVVVKVFPDAEVEKEVFFCDRMLQEECETRDSELCPRARSSDEEADIKYEVPSFQHRDVPVCLVLRWRE